MAGPKDGLAAALSSDAAPAAAAGRRTPTTSRRVLIIDNYDSFTYNLVQYLAELGSDVTVWRNDVFDLDDVADLAPERIVLSPGPCTPSEAGATVDVVKRYGSTIPTLGVCLGHQAIGAAYGGVVVRAGRLMHGKTSAVSHDGSGAFNGLPTPFRATRYHSLVVEELPSELLVNAWLEEDGERVVMGVRHVEHPVWGVQFHPESVLTEHGHALLANFLDVEVPGATAAAAGVQESGVQPG